MELHLWLGLLPAFSIAILNWTRFIFILNKFKGYIPKSQVVAFILFMFGGYAAWIAELSIMQSNLAALQFVASMYRTFVNWLGIVFIVNDTLLITRQQVGSLLFVCIISLLWEVQHRLMLRGQI
jgi:hypothetical protein